MRILFITRKYPPSMGGMEIYSKELFDALLGTENDVELCKPVTPILGRPSLLRLATFIMGACMKLLRYRASYDAVLLGDFCLAPLALVAKAFMRPGVRVAVAMHGNDLYFMRKRTVLAGIYRLIGRMVVASNALDAAIANSHAIQCEAFSRGIRNISVVPLATRLLSFTGQEDLPRRKAILFAGRLIRYKGLSWFVDQVLPKLDSSVELLVAGEIWDESERACLDRDSRIRYLGAIPYQELAKLRAQVAACVMPNIPPSSTEQDEGFGLAALDAPAAGTPILAAACGGLPDAVADGKTGFLLAPLDAAAWVRRLDDVLSWSPEDYVKFARDARSHIAKFYNWPLVARRTVTVLENSR